MRLLAKHPNGPAYELTREELETQSTVRRLGIDESWVVQVGGEWVPLGPGD